MGGNTKSGQPTCIDELTSQSGAKVKVKGNATGKPANAAAQKANKEELSSKTTSEIKSKAIPGKEVGKAAQPCPLKSSDKNVPKKKKATEAKKAQCNLTGLKVDKSGRHFVLNVKGVQNACVSESLEIVAGFNARASHVSCSVLGIAGPCQQSHKKKVIDFTDDFESKSDTSLKFKAYSKYAFNFFPARPQINNYKVNANTCGASVGAEIIVYPDTHWKVHIRTEIKGKKIDDLLIEGEYKEDQNNLNFSASLKEGVAVDYSNDKTKIAFKNGDDETKFAYETDSTKLGFANTKGRVESAYENKDTNTKSHTSFNKIALNEEPGNENALEGKAINEISLESGNVKMEVDEKIKERINSIFSIIQKINFIADIVNIIFKESESPVEFDIDWPAIDLKGEWQWKEISGSAKCGFEYSLSGALEPLIGCNVNVDLVGAVILSIPGVGYFAKKCFELAEYITGNELKVNLKLSGAVNVDVNISKKAADVTATIVDPSTHVDIILDLKATLALKDRNFWLGYGGGVEGAAKISVFVHKPVVTDDDILLPCEFQFMGVTISQITYSKPGSIFSSVLPDEDDEAELEEDRKDLKKDWLQGNTQPFNLPLI